MRGKTWSSPSARMPFYGNSTGRQASISDTKKRSFKMCGQNLIRLQGRRRIVRIFSSRKPASGFRVVPAHPAATIGTLLVPPTDEPFDHPAQPELSRIERTEV